MRPEPMVGRVVLVGAGPGDPGLLTIRGRAALEEAEVVVYDRLVNPELLNLAPPSARRIFAGKTRGDHTMPQSAINAVLVHHARLGRQFSPEEMGGLDRGMIRNTQKTFGITTGFKGTWGTNWDWEAALSHSQYQSTIGWPQIVASKANALFLGPQLGVAPDYGLPVFNADPARLDTPLTQAEYDSIAQ